MTRRIGLKDASSRRRPIDRVLLFGFLWLRRRAIAAAALHRQHHLQFARARQVGNHQFRVHDFNIVITGDVAGCHRTGPFLGQRQLPMVARVHADGDIFEIQQNLNHVFLHTLDAGVLVQHTLDLGFDNGRTRHAGKQHSTQRIAQRVTKATLEGFNNNPRPRRALRLDVDTAGLQKFYG